MPAAIGELILCAVVAIACWPTLSIEWRRHYYSDELAAGLALLLEVSAIAGLVHAIAVILT